MARQAPDPTRESIQQAAALLRRHAFGWRVGSEHSPELAEARATLTDRMKLDVEAAARGDVPVDPALRELAVRAHAFIRSAGTVDEACNAWSRMRAEVLNEPIDVVDARSQAVRDASSVRARELWTAARAAMRSVVGRDFSEASGRLARDLPGRDAADGAREFLDATKDLWLDAQDFAVRRYRRWADVPETLLHAQVFTHAHPDELIPTAASRHIARLLVETFARNLPPPRRVALRPMVAVPGFASVGDDGAPRIAWHERRGVSSMIDLCQLTLEGCVMALTPGASSLFPSTFARLMVLGLLSPPVVRKALGLGREDAARVRRQCATWLMREARIAASLALARPTVPEEAMDALATATRSDPDVAEAAAACAPWPHPGPMLGPVALEHGHAWRSLVVAGALAPRVRDAWDEDFSLRGAFHTELVQLLPAVRDDVKAFSARLGVPDPTWTGLRSWLEETLA